jgi:hypothetical protein
MDSQELVDFVVRGIDDDGKPSRQLLQVAEVAVINEAGTSLGRFRNADGLSRFLMKKARGTVRLVALETVGLPRLDLAGKYTCYEQASLDWLVPRQEP